VRWRPLLLLGLTSLFADWLYEGARAVLPQYLAYLGATAFLVGLIFGLGDAMGYALRLVSGPLSDRRGGYWAETFLGYSLQVLAVVALAFAPWAGLVFALVLLERASKAWRTPSRDVLVSSVGARAGLAFGVHGLLDQVGAAAGALMAAFLLFMGLGYRPFFLLLGLPGLLAIIFLLLAYNTGLRASSARTERLQGPLDRRVLLFALAQFLVGVSLPHVSLAMYRFSYVAYQASLIYLAAMLFEALASGPIGIIYDRLGRATLLVPLLAPLTSYLFLGSYTMALAGAAVYSAVVGYSEVVAKAAASGLTWARATALGFVDAAFGFGVLLGSPLYGHFVDLGLHGPFLLLSASAAILGSLLSVLCFAPRPGGAGPKLKSPQGQPLP
jgi:MFS family permease